MGIVAHVDAGKTTLSEAMLHLTGEIKSPGRVDHGDAFLDNDPIERDRGITIFSQQARFTAGGEGGTEVTLIDTPGHVDFSAETERTLSVLDYALLVVSASEGVRPHTKTLHRMLKERGIPVFVFVNKMDIAIRSREELTAEVADGLGIPAADFSGAPQRTESFIDEVTLRSSSLAEAVLEDMQEEAGCVPRDEQIAAAVRAGEVVPVLFGAALRAEGVSELIEALDRYTEAAEYRRDFGAAVYKTMTAKDGEKLTFIKITGGTLRPRDSVRIKSADQAEPEREAKVNQIRLYSGDRFKAADAAEAGTVCAVTGLGRVLPGSSLGEEEPARPGTAEPFMVFTVEAPPEIDVHDLMDDMQVLSAEDPKLAASWSADGSSVQIRIMGQVQSEILRTVIKERFGYGVDFAQGRILYLETVSGEYEGVGHFEPLRHYAEVHLIVTPGERGSGIVITSEVAEDDLALNWQRLIMTHLEEKAHTGVLTGSPLTDVKISIAAGRAHAKHTEGGDFREATYRAVRNALMQAKRDGKAVLLEPWSRYEIELPAQHIGRALTDIKQMGGSNETLEQAEESAVISGRVPSAGFASYQQILTGYTAGAGKLRTEQCGYDECHNADEVIEEVGYEAERDTENPADSVFVNHKGSDIVRWDEVTEHMHIAGVLERRARAAEAPAPAVVSRADVREEAKRRLAGEKELQRIFEMTYGPVRTAANIEKKERSFGKERVLSDEEAARNAERNEEIRAKHERKAEPKEEEPLLILVDGYNLIYGSEELKQLADRDIGSARDSLVDRMVNYAGYTGFEVKVIFDAYKVVPGAGSSMDHDGVTVIYTAENESADVRIGRMIKDAKDRRIYIVSSDRLVQENAWTRGAMRIPSREFIEIVDRTEEEIRDLLKG